jgi:hypothetical protein
MQIDAGDCLPLDAVAEVPTPIAEVVARAMHRNKDQRIASMPEVKAAWQGARRR